MIMTAVPVGSLLGLLVFTALADAVDRHQPPRFPTAPAVKQAPVVRAAPQAKTATSGVSAHSMGRSVSVGFFSYLVTKAWWREIPGREFLFIEITARSNADNTHTVPPFVLFDDDRDAQYRRLLVGELGEFPQGLKLNPGVSRTGLLVFEVPRGRRYKLAAWGGTYREAGRVLFTIVPGAEPASSK